MSLGMCLSYRKKEDEISQQLGKDAGGEACRKKGKMGKKLWGKKRFVLHMPNVVNFFWNKYWSLTHKCLKRGLSANIPFPTNISILSA